MAAPNPIDFRQLFEAVPGLYLVLEPSENFEIVAVSDAYLAATLTTRAAVIGRGLFEVFPDNPADPAADGVRNLRASLERVKATRQADSMAVQKYDIARPDGSFEERHWSPRNFPVIGADGALVLIVHRVEDVTAYVELRGAAARHAEETGRHEAEILARSKELHQLNEQLRQLHESLEQRVAERTRQLEAANASLRAEMLERERAESQFRQAQKMETIGQLAGGVAHDFNNLLTVILSCTALARGELAPEGEAARDLEDVDRAARRAAALTRQLLAFSRTHVVSPVLLDLNEIVDDSTGILQRLLGEAVSLVGVRGANLGLVRIDRALLEQVVMNLVVNARDAMPRGGKITIETAMVELDGSARGVLGAKPGSYVMLAVTDTGTGMDTETQEKIFQPFFTTKEVGRGTGLGLAMVHGVVKQNAGEILVYSAPGKGTTFKILLPAEAGARAVVAEVAPAPPVRPTESVLLVEDEAAVREVARRVLVAAGYRVETAPLPAEALALPAHEFDLVIVDVVMPGMDGPTFIEHLARRARPPRVLFMSGYTGGALVHQKIIESQAPFLQKPFVPADLLRAVRSALS